MEAYRPKYYIETIFERIPVYGYNGYDKDKIVGYRDEPFDYCNGEKIQDMPNDRYEKIHHGALYWESYWFNQCIRISRYNDKIWTDRLAMDKAFEVIFTKKSEGEGVYTPMQDFEIWLMCKGYEMISFDKMCSQTPCFSIVEDRVVYTRFYHNKETGKTIYFAFGIKSDNLKFKFYFVHSDKMWLNYQTPVKPEDFERAEKLELKSFQELNYEVSKKKRMLNEDW